MTVAAGGCAERISTFEIVDYREAGEAKRYHETFDEAYYAFDYNGNIDIILRRTTPNFASPGHTVVQVVHIHGVWHCIPGETAAHRTQINATASYHIIAGQVGASFEGAGSLFVRHDPRKNTLTGSLDLAMLRPTRRLAASYDLFKQAELKGRFHAKCDPRCVVRITNEMNRLFGPLPPNSE